MQVSDTEHSHLPSPDAASLEHSERVVLHIKGVIEARGGSIGFAEFMHEALYAAGLGYYTAGATRFGAGGDFITAPEASPLFTKVLGNQVAAVLRQFGSASEPSVLEIGAGSGALAVELLKHLELLGSLPSQYFILDVSADLQQKQLAAIKAELPRYVERVSWLAEIPEDFSGVMIANEVLDALPVERFIKRDGHVFRQTVRMSDGRFAWATEPAPDILISAVLEIEAGLGHPLADGYLSEVCLAAPDWISRLAEGLQKGFIFLFDYGTGRKEYYAEDRSAGWLRCYFRHRVHKDPLINAGIQDLTAWVNFTQVANAAFDAGLRIAGYVTQAQFLLHGGLLDELRDIAELPTETQIQLSRQVKLLTMPGEMGENFKCLGLSKGEIEAPEPFAMADRAHTL